MWSNVSSDGANCLPQYWQHEWSRSRMFLRESERRSNGICRYSVRRITEGACRVTFWECSMCPLCSSMRATPLKTITTARRSVHTLMGSKEAFRTSTRAFIIVVILRQPAGRCQNKGSGVQPSGLECRLQAERLICRKGRLKAYSRPNLNLKASVKSDAFEQGRVAWRRP